MTQIKSRTLASHPTEGRIMIVTDAGVKSCGGSFGSTGLDKTFNLQGDGGKRARSPGRAQRKPLKPLRAGMPGDSGVLVVTRVRSTTTKCTRGRGCNGHPAFPTPSKGRKIHQRLGRIARRGRRRAFGRHCERSEAIHKAAKKEWIASLRSQ